MSLIVSIILVSLVSFAQTPQIKKPLAFTCVTEMPTTSFVLEEQEETFTARIVHHNGAKYAPFFQNLIVPNDVPKLVDAAEIAQKMGSDYTVRFLKKSCERLNNDIFSCVGKGEVIAGAMKEIKPWHIGRTIQTVQTTYGEFKKQTMTLSFDIGSKGYEVVMDYQLGDCVFSELKSLGQQ